MQLGGGTCDSCGVTQAATARFQVCSIVVGIAAAGSTVDLCDDCEARFLSALAPFIGDDGALELRRDELEEVGS